MLIKEKRQLYKPCMEKERQISLLEACPISHKSPKLNKREIDKHKKERVKRNPINLKRILSTNLKHKFINNFNSLQSKEFENKLKDFKHELEKKINETEKRISKQFQ